MVVTALWLTLGLAACGSGGEASPSRTASVTTGEETGLKVRPLDVVGGGSGQFHVKGGDNSIQDYGHEAGGGELRRAALAVHGYFAALAREEWARACARLAPETAAQISKLAASSSGSAGRRCAAALPKLFGRVSAAEGREATVVDAASLRRNRTHGFLLYRGAGGKPYSISVEHLGGSWTVSGLSPTGLP